MSVFSFKKLFIQIALKTKDKQKCDHLPILATGGQNDRTDFAAVKLIHFRTVAAASWLLGNYHCLCQKVKFKSFCEFYLQRRFLSLKAAQRAAAQQGRTHLHQPGVDLNDPSVMKVGVFSSSLAYLQAFFRLLKRYPNTIKALLSILGILSREIIEFETWHSYSLTFTPPHVENDEYSAVYFTRFI